MDEFVEKTSIDGLLVLKRPKHEDERGFFKEIFHLSEVEQALNIEFKIVQVNHTFSKKGVLRGIHAEGWNKLIYPLNGEVFVAIVDMRPDSATFKKVETFTINDNDRFALFVSKGLGNSYIVTSDQSVDYAYFVDAYYDGGDQKAIAWNDPDVSIDWPIKDPIISERDKNNPKLRELFPEKFR